MIRSNHQRTKAANRQFTAGGQCKRTTDTNLHCATNRNRVIPPDVSGMSPADVDSIRTTDVIRTGCRDIHGITGTVNPAECPADNNGIRQTNNTGSHTNHILGEVSSYDLAAVSPHHTALVHPDRFAAVDPDSGIRVHPDSLGVVNPDKLGFVQFGHTGHISFRLLPILFESRFIVKTDTVIVGFTAADSTAD